MQDTLSQTFSALADPTRRAMLARLKQGETNVTELAEPFLGYMTLGGVTKHLKVLEKAGLVTKGREAQWRPCTLNPAPLKDISNWVDEYRAEMEESLDRLGEYLKTVTSAEPRATDSKVDSNATAKAARKVNRNENRNTNRKSNPGNKR